VGGNDFGRTDVKLLKIKLCELLGFIQQTMPDTTIIWSQVLPRNWSKGLRKASKRFNSFAVKKVKECNGFYLCHPNLPFTPRHYDQDGVHLTAVGNDLFTDNIRVGLFHFLRGNQPWFE